MKKGKKLFKNKIILPEEKVFLEEYSKTGNSKDSARVAYPHLSENSLQSKAEAIFNKEAVQDYINKQAQGAAERIAHISINSENAMVQLAANKDILDRAGFKPKDDSITINMPLYLPPEITDKYGLTDIKKIQSSTEEIQVIEDPKERRLRLEQEAVNKYLETHDSTKTTTGAGDVVNTSPEGNN